MSKISKKAKEKHMKSYGDHRHFLSRITKTLYYGKLPNSDRLSLPVTEFATELFSEAKIGRSLERLHCNDAAAISRSACISPCSFILAMVYLERLKTCNPEYLQRIHPSELFLISLMVSSKFLYDDGQEDEVFVDEWAISGGLSVKELVHLEKEFLNAMKWEIFVNDITFWKKLNELERIIAKKEGSTRGWFTYTELNSILVSMESVSQLYHYIAYIMVVLLVTYTAGILTVATSMLLVSYVPGNSLQQVKSVGGNDTFTYIPDRQKCPNEVTEINTNDTIDDLEEFKCDIFEETPVVRKHIDAVDVLKTGLILATIKAASNKNFDSNKSFYENDISDDENNEKITWDWWSSPALNWLTSSSEPKQNFDFIPEFKYYTYTSHYPDVTIVNMKLVEMKDHVQSYDTQTRIQDQLERSWHKEWTDTIKYNLFSYNKPFELLQNLKT